MKVVPDEDLSVVHAHTQKIAKSIAKREAKKIIDIMIKHFKNDKKFGELGYMGIMTFINTVGTHLFCQMFEYSCYIGTQFKDADHSRRDLFEEVHAGLRILLDLPEISKTEYTGGIKKIMIPGSVQKNLVE
jgi:hypothetical protein